MPVEVNKTEKKDPRIEFPKLMEHKVTNTIAICGNSSKAFVIIANSSKFAFGDILEYAAFNVNDWQDYHGEVTLKNK